MVVSILICILKRISEELRKGCKSGRKEHLVMSHETGGFSAVGKGGQVDVQIRAVSLVGFQRCGDSTHLIAEMIMMNRIRYLWANHGVPFRGLFKRATIYCLSPTNFLAVFVLGEYYDLPWQ
jgi:hypothetical protein